MVQNDIASTGHAYCPLFKFDMQDQSGSAIDPALFTFVEAGTNDLTTIDPLDLTKAGVYNMRFLAYYDGDPSHYPVVPILDFTIELVDPCLIGTLTILPAMTSAAITYNIQTTSAPII